MLSIKITVPERLNDATRRLMERAQTNPDAMEAAGNAAEMVLRAHFARLNTKPNKRGFHKTNFWNQIENATSMTEYSGNSATVTIADARFPAKVDGAIITPKTAKALAIPLTDQAYGKRPSEWDKKILHLIPRRNRPSILATIGGSGEITPHYVLLKKARVPADPDALPAAEKLWEGILREVETNFTAI